MNNNENENENETETETIENENNNNELIQTPSTSSNVKVIKSNSDGKEIEPETSEGNDNGNSNGNGTGNSNGNGTRNTVMVNNLGTGNSSLNRIKNKNKLGNSANTGTKISSKSLGKTSKLTMKNTSMNGNQEPTENNTTSHNNNNNNNNNITKVESLTNESNKNNTTSDLLKSLNKLCMNLLNHQIVLKLFHFQTTTYGAHKASDAYLAKYANNMDRFLEVVQGIYGKFTLKQYGLGGSSHTNENIGKHLNGMIKYFKDSINDILGEHTELINIRDELLSEIEQLKYLLTFQ